ncbi:MAG: hypothetical protein WCY30_00225 [Candidatus Neomarinimicrobiota bacterium]|jgi:NTP pyrophosphatase (non-canonical NTP hydrolase)
MAKCLRCGAGNEWIQGRIKKELMNNITIPKELEKYGVIDAELIRVKQIHPKWKKGMCWQSVVIVEEAGEIAKAVLHYKDEGGTLGDIRKELIHTAAMCMRMLENLNDDGGEIVEKDRK